MMKRPPKPGTRPVDAAQCAVEDTSIDGPEFAATPGVAARGLTYLLTYFSIAGFSFLLNTSRSHPDGCEALPSRAKRPYSCEAVVEAELVKPMRMLPQVAWPAAGHQASETSDTGSDRTSSSSSTSSPQRKRNCASRDDADEDPPCEHTAASSLLMLFEEEGKPAVAPMPFFQFPRIAPAALSSAPLVKRPCFSFGTKALSATMVRPQRTDLSRGDASRADCSPRVSHSRAPPSSLEIQEAMSKMVQDRLCSGSASSE